MTNVPNTDLFDELQGLGHWRVEIRPLRFEADRISSLSDCLKIVESSQVRLRGWPFPYVALETIGWGSDFVQGTYRRSADNKEAWRLFQSGLFIDYHAISEDHHELPWTSTHFPNGLPQRYIEYLSTVFHLTEIFEFAARLAEKDLLLEGAFVSITLTDLMDRYLLPWTPDFYLPDDLICRIPHVAYERVITSEELLSSSKGKAVEASAFIFERFGWRIPDQNVLSRVQDKLFERR